MSRHSFSQFSIANGWDATRRGQRQNTIQPLQDGTRYLARQHHDLTTANDRSNSTVYPVPQDRDGQIFNPKQPHFHPYSRSVREPSAPSAPNNAHTPPPPHAHPPTAARNLNPTPGAHTFPCRWGSCGIALDDGSPGGIKRHLAQFHSHDVCAGTSHACRWLAADGARCPTSCASVVTLTRHVATVHVQSTKQPCPRCGTPISRKDALTRHLQASCNAVGDCPPL